VHSHWQTSCQQHPKTAPEITTIIAFRLVRGAPIPAQQKTPRDRLARGWFVA
jgi:hypothetical protein